MGIILHIVKREDWEQTQRAGRYQPASLELEHFIHCSTVDQVINIANTLYRGQKGLVLLCIDTASVSPFLRWESPKDSAILFPHIYSALAPSAVLHIEPFEPEPSGTFSLPKTVADLCRTAA